MFKRILLAFSLFANLTWVIPSLAQNTQCSDRPNGDSSNACANTRFVQNNGGGGGGGTPGGLNLQVQYNNSGVFGGLTDIQLTARMQQFTSLLSGAVPGSGGGVINFLRADGSWAPIAGNAPVGTILPWAGASVPATYQLAYGQAISRASFPDLLTTITFNPSITCTSGSPTITVTADTANRVPINTPVESSACFAAGTRVLSKGATSLTLTSNAIASTNTTARIFPWGNGDGSTTFNVPDLQGRAALGRDNMSGTAAARLTTSIYGSSPDTLNAPGGSQSTTLVQANLPSAALTTTITDPGHVHNIIGADTLSLQAFAFATGGAFGVGGGGTGLRLIDTANGGISAASHTTGITASTALGGSSTPFSTIQPSLTLDYIIKVLPDSTVPGSGLVVGVTAITGGTTTNILYNNAGVLGEYALATLTDMYAGTSASKLVTPSVIWPTEVTVTYGTTTTFDMSTFRDAVVTLTGNITTQTVSNVVVGKAGSITFIQDGTGSRTTVWDSKFKFTGGITPTLTTTAGAVDILSYSCRTSTFCYAAMMNDVK